MTHEEIISSLKAIAQALDDRVEIWRVVREMDGTVSQRIYRGSFFVPHNSHHSGDTQQ